MVMVLCQHFKSLKRDAPACPFKVRFNPGICQMSSDLKSIIEVEQEIKIINILPNGIMLIIIYIRRLYLTIITGDKIIGDR